MRLSNLKTKFNHYLSWLFQYAKKTKQQFAKFFIIGISSTLIDLGLLIFLKEKINLNPVLAVVINQIFVIIYSFLMNKYWSFQSKNLPVKQFFRYLILVSANYLISILLMLIFNHFIGINYQIVRISSIGILFIFNFIFYKHWVYK